MDKATCSIDGCDRPASSRGWCAPHHKRWCRNGDPGTAPIKPRRTGCLVDKCDRPHSMHGYCQKHAYRYVTNGDPLVTRSHGGPLGETNYSWQGDDVGYAAVHGRLYRHRGAAKNFGCVGCSRSAAGWAYQHTASDERMCTKVGLPFTTDLSHYEPMCHECHAQLDAHHGWTHPRWFGKGACFNKRTNRWRAYATFNGQQHSGGTYLTEAEAAEAASNLRAQLLSGAPV